MINHEVFQAYLERYKKVFLKHWKNEKYKWEALQHFQKKWNIEAEDFTSMLSNALAKTKNLLDSGFAYPRSILKEFAEADPEATRSAIRNLFDESKPVADRVTAFMAFANDRKENHNETGWKNHYQDLHAISVYLWLRYPDKYYIYKYSVARPMAKTLKANFIPKKTLDVKNLIATSAIYDEMNALMQADNEIKDMVEKACESIGCEDPALHTATCDFAFYVTAYYPYENKEEWYPSLEEYNPGLTVDDWKKLLQDPDVFTENALTVVARFMDMGGAATCKQLSDIYGESRNYYNGVSSTLGKKVAEKTGCPLRQGLDNEHYWPVMYVGREASGDIEGNYIWKLRDELMEALQAIDLSGISLFAEDESVKIVHPCIWKISHGILTEAQRQDALSRCVTVVSKLTKSTAKEEITQGDYYVNEIKNGDYFYLCYGSEVKLFGKFDTDTIEVNPIMDDEWLDRHYQIIAEANNNAPYTADNKWWAPSFNSTCRPIAQTDLPLFEKLILKPYFDMTINDVFGSNTMTHYWWLNANPRIWSFSSLSNGETQEYTLLNDNGHKRRIYQNFIDAKVGDMVIGYESTPVKQIVALAKIAREQNGQDIVFEKVEQLATPIDYATLQNCPELAEMEYFLNPQGSLFKLTEDEYNFILDIIRDENPLKKETDSLKAYTVNDFLKQVYMKEKQYYSLTGLLKRKKNVILQGAPGVGKTFAAERLAYAMMGVIDDSRIERVQFHQNYSYEDFIMGYKPEDNGFKLKRGIFYNFCKKAEQDPNKKDYFFIIDEINRGNMSKIFGELLMLIEADYRGKKIALAYNGESFSVPENLYIIGMMNTADRSLAMIDYALRRRFSFYTMEPGFLTEGFIRYQKNLENDTFDRLIKTVCELNEKIKEDGSLGAGFRIGHSYFCNQKQCTSEWMRDVVHYDLIPTLQEYWFDNPSELDHWEKVLCGVVDDQ